MAIHVYHCLMQSLSHHLHQEAAWTEILSCPLPWMSFYCLPSILAWGSPFPFTNALHERPPTFTCITFMVLLTTQPLLTEMLCTFCRPLYGLWVLFHDSSGQRFFPAFQVFSLTWHGFCLSKSCVTPLSHFFIFSMAFIQHYLIIRLLHFFPNLSTLVSAHFSWPLYVGFCSFFSTSLRRFLLIFFNPHVLVPAHTFFSQPQGASSPALHSVPPLLWVQGRGHLSVCLVLATLVGWSIHSSITRECNTNLRPGLTDDIIKLTLSVFVGRVSGWSQPFWTNPSGSL